MNVSLSAGPTSSRKAQRLEVERVLDDFHAAASEADEERYLGHFHPDAVFLGTDATERWDKASFQEYLHPYFEGGDGWTFDPIERHVDLSLDRATAWFDERLMNAKYGECRGSGVLVRDRGRWKVVQYNLAFPVPNEAVDDFLELLAETP